MKQEITVVFGINKIIIMHNAYSLAQILLAVASTNHYQYPYSTELNYSQVQIKAAKKDSYAPQRNYCLRINT